MAKYRACIIPELSDKPFNATKASIQHIKEDDGSYTAFILEKKFLNGNYINLLVGNYISFDTYESMNNTIKVWHKAIGNAIFRSPE